MTGAGGVPRTTRGTRASASAVVVVVPADHNTRIIVFGKDRAQARALAEAILAEAFHNVAYFADTFEALRSAVK